MCVRYLGFLFLAWLPGVVDAETACSPPELSDGYFVPQQETYPHGKTLTYACENGFTPVEEGWWATSTCQNGKWSPSPQCRAPASCLPPTIPNGKYEKALKGWYDENSVITVSCEDGFKLKRRNNRARCVNGGWTPVLSCEKSSNACDEPNKIPHGVIITQGPQEVYAQNSQLQYECEDGYITRSANDRGSITCRAGSWTPEPTCIPAACTFDPARHIRILNQTTPIKIKMGEIKEFTCVYYPYFRVLVMCFNGIVRVTDCCDYSISPEYCPLYSV